MGGGVHFLAAFGLGVSIFSITILAVQLVLMQKRRRESMNYEITVERVIKAIRKGTSTAFAAQFILSGLFLSILWLGHSVAYRIFISFRHVFFLTWHIAVLRHWAYVFDPLGRRVRRARMDVAWLGLRVILVLGTVVMTILLLIPDDQGLGKYESWEVNEVVWSFSSALVIYSCGVFLLFLKRMHRSCLSAKSQCRKDISDEEAMTISIVLQRPVVDIKYLMHQSAETMYLGFEVHNNAIWRCAGFCAVSIACAVIQELLWVVYLARGRDKLDVFADHNSLRAVYFWLPEVVPFCYWLWVLSTAKHVFVDEQGHTPNNQTSEEIVRTSSFMADEGLLLSVSEYCDEDRISFQQVDTGAAVISVEKSKNVTRSEHYSSYFSWMTDAVLVGGREFQFARNGPSAPGISYRPSQASEHRSSASLPKDILAEIAKSEMAKSREQYREVFISCSEMVLLDKLSDIPVGSIFSGQICFVVLSVSESQPRPDSPAAPIWIEVGRSELIEGKFNPDFRVAFNIPRCDEADLHKTWRLEIYNVVVRNQYINIPRFNVVESDLKNSFLAGIAFFSGQDLRNAGVCGGLVTIGPDEYVEIVRPIISAPYEKSILRFGGAISFRIRNMDLYCRRVPMVMATRGVTSRPVHRTHASVDDLESNENTEDEPAPLPPFIVKSYALRVLAKAGIPEHSIYLREECIESPYSLSVPLAFLNALLTRRTRDTTSFGKYIMYMKDDDFSKTWLSDLLEKKIGMLRVYSSAIESYSNRKRLLSNGDFKSSKAKTDHELRFIPVNLHLQAFMSNVLRSHAVKDSKSNGESDGECVHHIVTSGAFTAHSLKFKEGGIWQYLNKYQKRKLELNPSAEGPEEPDLSGPQYASSMDIWHLSNIPVDREMQHLAHAASERIDICLSQCLAALVTGFVARIQDLAEVSSPEELDNLCALGILVQFESLLSTQGKESGMLQDMYCTVRCLDCIQFRLHEAPSVPLDSPAEVHMQWEQGDSGNSVLVIDLGVASSFFATLTPSIQQGTMIPIVPVMFSVGINEFQSIANMAGSNALHLQEVINIESLCRLKEYIELRHKLQKGAFDDDIVDNDDSVVDERGAVAESDVDAFLGVLSDKAALESETSDAPNSNSIDGSILKSLQEVQDIERTLAPDQSNAITTTGSMLSDEDQCKDTFTPKDKTKWTKVRSLRRSILMTEEGRKMTSGMLLLDPTNATEEGEGDPETEKPENKISPVKFGILEVAKKQLPTFNEMDSDDEDEIVSPGAPGSTEPFNSSPASGVRNETLSDFTFSSYEIGNDVEIGSQNSLSTREEPSSRSTSIELSSTGRSSLAVVLKPEQAQGPTVATSVAMNKSPMLRRKSYVPSLPGNLPSAGAPYPARVESKADVGAVFNAMISVDEGDEESDNVQPVAAAVTRPQSKQKRGSALKTNRVNYLFNELNDVVGQSVGAGGKPWQILTLAAHVTRLVDGIRLTSCKSGKDRTGMSVTLEEVTIAKNRYKLADTEAKELLDTTRSYGVRLKNAEKNIGKAKFAFNSFQRQFLPEEYAPPLCAIGFRKNILVLNKDYHGETSSMQ